MGQTPSREFLLRVSYLEIYNEVSFLPFLFTISRRILLILEMEVLQGHVRLLLDNVVVALRFEFLEWLM